MGREARRIYLAYGSNLHPRRLQARVGTVELLGVVALPGWSLRFDKRGGDGSAKANLHPVPGRTDCAMAAAYSLRPDQLRRLDLYEGCGCGYETVDFTVDIKGDSVDAFTYLVPSQWVTHALLPFDWYVELIVTGARFHGFDQSIVQEIREYPAQRDDVVERARRELSAMGLPTAKCYKT